ncbi:MAG: methyltransferase domain-containing protein [Actinomycetota bacterium]|nr:methyltransferase domain-containing protein [Actinomycetota bacterium]
MTAEVLAAVSVADAFSAALRGEPCRVWGIGSRSRALPVASWTAPVSGTDLAILSACVGPTLDIGCGPGRFTAALAARGQVVLGIDLVAEAVNQTRQRGASALQRNVFDPLPGEGRWQTALLADGNIGIGGDPVALLGRARELVAPYGRIVVDLAPHGNGWRVHEAWLECAGSSSARFPWSVVAPEALPELASRAGLRVEVIRRFEDRWFGVLVRSGR